MDKLSRLVDLQCARGEAEILAAWRNNATEALAPIATAQVVEAPITQAGAVIEQDVA